MATSGTDILFFAMLAGGGILVVMNWKCLTDGTFCGLGGDVTPGNCAKHADGQNNKYCWNGSHTVCLNGKTVVQNSGVCITCTQPSAEADCCNAARTAFIDQFPNKQCTIGGNCSGGYVPSGGQCVCNPTAKGCTSSTSCVHMTNTTCQCLKAGPTETHSGSGCNTGQYRCKLSNGACGCCTSSGGGCTKGYVKCTGGCCCNPVLKNCNLAQITTLVNGNCTCTNCQPGYKRGGNGNQCVPIGGTGTCQPCYVQNGNVCQYNPGSGAAWIARVANAMLFRMCNSCQNKVPSISQIASGWPSLTTQCAVDNSCNLNKLHTSYSVFNKHFAQLLIAIRNSYSIPITVNAANALAVQQGNGVWWLNPWAGGVAGFYGKVGDVPNPFQDNRPGDSYARALEGRYNRWNPYGDNRYAYTLPTSMKVRVS